MNIHEYLNSLDQAKYMTINIPNQSYVVEKTKVLTLFQNLNAVLPGKIIKFSVLDCKTMEQLKDVYINLAAITSIEEGFLY
ncbi:MAG: hypothetical protein COY53_07260 [Elusimicrobia bacterium CG_4_10_14_0_8_um_filter_37_32]|nr:MAG: hypothetical protein COY53_07260 [Elusimicrobia bacterium CG_4_10_14_0_8_um_filter_37_32]